MSRSTVVTKDAWDLSKARFRAELLRVTDPRSDKIAQPPKSFTDRSTAKAFSQGPAGQAPSGAKYL